MVLFTAMTRLASFWLRLHISSEYTRRQQVHTDSTSLLWYYQSCLPFTLLHLQAKLLDGSSERLQHKVLSLMTGCRSKSWPGSVSQIRAVSSGPAPECGCRWNHRLQMVTFCWALRGPSSRMYPTLLGGHTSDHISPNQPSVVKPMRYHLGSAPAQTKGYCETSIHAQALRVHI